eukprot:143085-Hanusia_phi.AAC.1
MASAADLMRRVRVPPPACKCKIPRNLGVGPRLQAQAQVVSLEGWSKVYEEVCGGSGSYQTKFPPRRTYKRRVDRPALSSLLPPCPSTLRSSAPSFPCSLTCPTRLNPAQRSLSAFALDPSILGIPRIQRTYRLAVASFDHEMTQHLAEREAFAIDEAQWTADHSRKRKALPEDLDQKSKRPCRNELRTLVEDGSKEYRSFRSYLVDRHASTGMGGGQFTRSRFIGIRNIYELMCMYEIPISSDTTAYAVRYYDTCLVSDKLQEETKLSPELALSCGLLAMKFMEVSIPVLMDVCNAFPDTTATKLSAMEGIILQALDFEISFVTASQILGSLIDTLSCDHQALVSAIVSDYLEVSHLSICATSPVTMAIAVLQMVQSQLLLAAESDWTDFYASTLRVIKVEIALMCKEEKGRAAQANKLSESLRFYFDQFAVEEGADRGVRRVILAPNWWQIIC